MRTSFVGRERELAALEECLEAALAGRPRVVLCRGEPGIGKTRLAEALSEAAATTAVLTAWGRAEESEGVPPYWPWRQVLRAVGEDVDLRTIAREHRLDADLARLAPDQFVDAAGVRDGVGSADDRFRVFDAVDQLLREVTRRRPMVIFFDDAHWADESSLLLLRHVARSMAGQRLLIIVNHRDTEPVHEVLGTGLPREPAVRELTIGGLAVPEVGAQLALLLGRSASGSEIERVHAHTGGNPFYVGEVGRLLADHPLGGDRVPVPAGVQGAIGARLHRLPGSAVQLLRAASVVGREFSLAVVAAVAELAEDSCLPLLDEALAAGFVSTTSSPAHYRFQHDLVRDAVEAGLGAPDRAKLHRRAAEALERLHAGRLDAHLSDLARHWAAAAGPGERARAVGWIRQAADEAVHRLAYEEGVRLYRLALTVGADEIDDAVRCRLLLHAGGALKAAGQVSDRPAVSREAAALARRLRRPDLLAEAALVMEGGESDLEAETTLRSLCEEALAALPPDPTALRARVAANLSDACMYLGDVEAARRASERALALAGEGADPAALAAALRARQLVASGPEGVDERARLADRMVVLGRENRDPAVRMWGHLWLIDVAFERGDLPAVARELEPLARCAEELRTPVARWHLLQCSAVLAQAQARFADARQLADQAVAALPPSATGRESAAINRTALRSLIALHTGDTPDLTGLLGYSGPGGGHPLDFPTEGVIFSIAAAFILARAGRPDDAATVYRRLGPPATWRPIPHATVTSFAIGTGAAIVLDARDDVVVLRGRLAPFRGRHVADGAGAIAYNGPVDLYLGVAAGFLGLLDDAVADLESAERACAANGAAGFRVEAWVELADILTRRARPGDVPRARAIAADVGRQAAELGMNPWADRARRLLERLDDERGHPLTPREREVAVLVGEGLTNRQIAARLYLSERTAQNHVQHILTKLGLPNRGQIAVWVTTGHE